MLKKKLLVLNKNQGYKKIIVSKTAKSLLIGAFVLAVFLFAAPALAAALDVGMQPVAENIALGTQDLRITIAKVIRAALGLLGIIAVSIVLYGGFLYMTSAGNEEKIDKAKKTLINGFIGLLIILSAFAITQFILMALTGGMGGGTGSERPRYGSGGGALGGGIIESHYPERNALDIPRNTAIVVTFKEAMAVNSIINDTNQNGTWGDCVDEVCDLLNPSSVKIRKTDDTSGPYIEQVKAAVTADSRTFVFKPVNFLGPDDAKWTAIWHTVELTGNILKLDGSSALGVYESYDWKFEVTNRVDNQPPIVEDVLPRYTNDPGNRVPRNMVIQINFSEAINPIAVKGLTDVVGGTVGDLVAGTFKNLRVSVKNGNEYNGDNYFVAGEYFISNGYQTVEFVTNSLCGKNTCGGDVYCLPAVADINDPANVTVLVQAATLGMGGVVYPYDGVVDMADNSLDGNKDGQSKGPVNDPYYLNIPTGTPADFGDSTKWSFYTNNNIELSPPEIESYFPAAGELGVDPDRSVSYETNFDRLLLSSTVKTGGEGYCACTNNNQCGNLTCDTVNSRCILATGRPYVCTVDCATGESCTFQREFFKLVQPAPELMPIIYPPGGWGYWMRSAKRQDKTVAILKHETIGENLNFGIHAGSGVKDLFQNCYQPCAGPGCVKEEVEPGVYQPVANEWKPNQASYPTCDLSSSAYETKGDFVLNYIDQLTGQQKNLAFSAISLDKAIGALYTYRNDGTAGSGLSTSVEGFNTAMSNNRSIAFIYNDNNESGRGDGRPAYYLVVVNGAPAFEDREVGAGKFYGTISEAPAEFSFAIRDDLTNNDLDNPAYCSDFDQNSELYAVCSSTKTLHISQYWNTGWADGFAIYLGDGSQSFSFNYNVVNFEPGESLTGTPGNVNPFADGRLPEWDFITFQSGTILLANSFPATIQINYIAD